MEGEGGGGGGGGGGTGGGGGVGGEYLVNANERQYLAKLCWLLHDAGGHALKVTLDSFHPPLVLRQHLGQHHVKHVLTRLKGQKVFTDKQWRTLYPTRKREIAEMSSESLGSRVLAVLLQFVCHLSPPYPHGWSALPLPQDLSLSADVVRLQMYLQQAGSLSGVRHEEYPVLWRQAVQVLLRMGGPEVRVKITRVDQETLPVDQQNHYISLVKSAWGAPGDGSLGALRRMGAGPGGGGGGGRGGGSDTRRAGGSDTRRGGGSETRRGGGGGGTRGGRNAAAEDGLTQEERAALLKTQRAVCEAAVAEDVVDRLVQGHVVSASDKHDILIPGKNHDRMLLLLSKVSETRNATGFMTLLDALSFKHPRCHEALVRAKKQIQKEGVAGIMDVVSVLQEGLATHYRSLFSRISPLPWSPALTSIRDVFVPLDVTTTDGKKLSLAQLFPAAVTSGRGKRVLVEGEGGSGKSYLASMVTYQWATYRDSFSAPFPFLIYLDARLVTGSLAKCLHSLVLPENFSVGPEEFWNVLEAHARNTVFVIDGFDEDHSSTELRELILGNMFRHATVLVTSRPEANAGRWMKPDERFYVMGLSSVNVGRCLKSYAVIAQMTSEEYDVFFEVVSRPKFAFREQLGIPYVCLALFGVYVARGADGVAGVTSLTSLFQNFLVAMATLFCRQTGAEMEEEEEVAEAENDEEGGSSNRLPGTLVSAISDAQRLAYKTLVSPHKTLGVASDLTRVLNLLKAAVNGSSSKNNYDVATGMMKAVWEAAEGGVMNGHGGGGETEREEGEEEEMGGRETGMKKKKKAEEVGVKGKGATAATTSFDNDAASLLTKLGLLTKLSGKNAGEGVGGGGGGRWVFTCSLTRDFLAARHLAGMDGEGAGGGGAGGEVGGGGGDGGGGGGQKLKGELSQQKILRHPRFAVTCGFLCALTLQQGESSALATLLQDLSIQVLKHSRRINFKDDASSMYTTSEDGDDVTAGGSDVIKLSHCLQALNECSASSPSAPLPDGESDPMVELVQTLPRWLVVRRDGLIPCGVLQGLAVALRHPACSLQHLELDLLPFHALQSSSLTALAQSLSTLPTLQSLVVRWTSLPLLITFLQTCLAHTPELQSVHLVDCTRRSDNNRHATAATMAGVQEVGSLLARTKTLVLEEFSALPVMRQFVLYLPDTLCALRFPACTFNVISAADLGSKLEASTTCRCLDLSDTCLESSDVSALFQNLKLNSSLNELILAGSHVDRASASALAEYIRLNSSLRRLDLSRCHVTDEACWLLSAALLENRFVKTVDLRESRVSEKGKEALLKTRPEEIVWLGFEDEFYS